MDATRIWMDVTRTWMDDTLVLDVWQGDQVHPNGRYVRRYGRTYFPD